MKNCPFYSIEERTYTDHGLRKYYGCITDAKTPKEAVKKYLLYYSGDKETIKYVKRARRKTGFNFAVTNTAKNKTAYFITM